MKTVLITGGTKGIGKAVALEFLKRGYEVVINYHSDERTALATQEEFNMLGYCPVLLRADVSDENQVNQMFEEFFGIYEKLDVLINNAGVSLVRVLQDTSSDEWNRVFGVNVKGVFHCCRAVADKMIGNGGGSIINISSVFAFTKALAKELAPSKVRVNCVSPGVIDTSMNSNLTGDEMEQLIESIPLLRIGYPEDVAQACAYLAEADYVTGEILSVGGGFAK